MSFLLGTHPWQIFCQNYIIFILMLPIASTAIVFLAWASIVELKELTCLVADPVNLLKAKLDEESTLFPWHSFFIVIAHDLLIITFGRALLEYSLFVLLSTLNKNMVISVQRATCTSSGESQLATPWRPSRNHLLVFRYSHLKDHHNAMRSALLLNKYPGVTLNSGQAQVNANRSLFTMSRIESII